MYCFGNKTPSDLERLANMSYNAQLMESPSSAIHGQRRLGNENLIKLTPSAGSKVNSLLTREQSGRYLRLAIKGGGCNGLIYDMAFTDEIKQGDILVVSAGAEVIVDYRSALYLKGTELDYSNSLISGGFRFSNPNATSTCSCGESFGL